MAFCDQDDIWLEEKIEAALEKMEQETGPVLYCSNKILVDSAGNEWRNRIPKSVFLVFATPWLNASVPDVPR